jgi:hypothetical protein
MGQTQMVYPTQGGAAMVPQQVPTQAYSNVIPFPQATPGMQPGYSQYGQTPYSSPSTPTTEQLLAQTIQALASGQSGQALSQPQVALPQAQVGMSQGYQVSQGYPQAQYQTPYQTSPQTYTQQAANYQPLPSNYTAANSPSSLEVTRLEMAVNQEANQKGLATSDELARYFGSPEIAATVQNAYATQLEDQLSQIVPYAQQLEQAYQQYDQLLTGPIEQLSDYYLQREEIEHAYGNPIQMYKPQPMAPQRQGQQAYGLPQADNYNPLLNAASIANQYQQNAYAQPQAAMRPQFPQVPVGNGPVDANALIAQAPPSQRAFLIDQLAKDGALRGFQVRF